MPEDSPRSPLVIVVLLKFTVDVNELKAIPQSLAPDLERAKIRINEFDENAIEEAVRLREKNGGRVIGLSLVPREPPREYILKALAVGLDEITLVCDGCAESGDSLPIATILAAAVRHIVQTKSGGIPDIILCGDISSDSCNGQTGPRVAEELGIGSVSAVTKLEIDQARIKAERTLEGRIDCIETEMPVVLTVGMETNQPRLPTVLQIMGAGRKPIHILSGDVFKDHAANISSQIRTLSIQAPPNRRKQIMVDGEDLAEITAKLLRFLKEDGEVFS